MLRLMNRSAVYTHDVANHLIASWWKQASAKVRHRTVLCSRIVARVDGPASTPRSDAAIIVTEYGVADRTLTVSRQVDALLRIAHPDDRDELSRAAGLGVGDRIRKKTR
jgi:acyl-CoA hydrolase